MCFYCCPDGKRTFTLISKTKTLNQFHVKNFNPLITYSRVVLNFCFLFLGVRNGCSLSGTTGRMKNSA